MSDTPFLDCYVMQDPPPPLVPGRAQREWMDVFAARQPYRCLPLTMANSVGWEIQCPFDITIEWNGGPGAEDLTITSNTPGAHVDGFVISHFRSGIVTFHTGYMFRTPPGWAVWCMGPQNAPKDGIFALSGLVETDWLPFPFTMNWQMTRAGRVSFAKGECFCFLTLMDHGRLDAITPTLRALSSNPELKENYALWQTSRSDFIEKLSAHDPSAVEAGWQKHYMRGEQVGSGGVQDGHITKRRLQMPVRSDPKKGKN